MTDEVKKEKQKKVYKRPLLHKIVNVFIGAVGLFLFLLIIFFGFSQTKTFRNFLKEQISNQVSSSLNANLFIENIEGSILSSVILQNVALYSEQDTILKAEEITVKTSPIHILLKRILVRETIIKNAYFKLAEDENGEWNISKLTSSNSTNADESVNNEGEGSSSFPFSIQANNIDFQNLNFIRQTYSKRESQNYYKHVNTEDLRLNNIFLNAKLFANLSSNIVRIYLNNFSVNPNFKSFNLKQLSGEIELTEEYARVSNFALITDSSRINLEANIHELNLLGGVELKEFEKYPLTLAMTANPFNFDDLSTFIDATDFLKGKANFDLTGDGYFGDLNINNLSMDYRNTHLNLRGQVKKLHTPENLFLDVEIFNSSIVENDAYILLKGLDIPNYPGLKLKNIELKYIGEPTKFNANLISDVNEGNLQLDVFMDLQQKETVYDIDYIAENLDLSPIINSPTILNSSGSIEGIGFDPQKMKAKLNITAEKSSYEDINFDSLMLSTNITGKELNIDLVTLINDAQTSVNGYLDLRDEESTKYTLNGRTNNFDLSTFTNEPSDTSNLNFTFLAHGENLNLDDLIGKYEVKLTPSFLRDIKLDETTINMELAKDNNQREINIVSEFVDFNIDGKFSLAKAIEILAYEGNVITNIISNKIEELNPIEGTDTVRVASAKEEVIPEIVEENLEFNFDYKFKDFELIALFLNNDELDISGSGEGYVKNDSLHFEIYTDLSIENLLHKNNDNIFYLSDIDANLNFSRDNREVSFNKIFGTISVEGNKIYAGTEINDVEADFIFNQSKLFFNTSLSLGENLNTNLEGYVTSEPSRDEITFDNIFINYKNIPWYNYDTSTVIFNNNGMQVSNLILENSNSTVTFNGQINNDKSHNFFLNIDNMPGAILSTYVLDEEKPFDAVVNLDFTSTGFMNEPKIETELNINDITYNEINFGSFTGVLSHLKDISKVNIDIVNKENDFENPLLILEGNLPLNISYLGDKSIIENDSQMDLKLTSNNFDLGSFGDLLPFVKNQKGTIDSKINITGTYDDINIDGFLNMPNGSVTYRDNNLDYTVNLESKFNDQTISIEKLKLSNSGGSKYKGTINASGNIKLEEFPFSSINMKAKGDLALLGKRSQTSQANIYGDLFVKTRNNLEFTYKNEKYNFIGDILVDQADLVYASKNVRAVGDNNDIKYVFIEDSSNIDFSNRKFIRILDDARNSTEIKDEEEISFDFRTNIIINNIATFNFIISPQLGQKLRVETTGELELETTASGLKTQGTLQLLDGSQLEFFKTFDAEGSIRFDSDITDPNLNVVATYINEIENVEGDGNSEEVAVKFRINSPLSKLGENLSSDKENLKVYVGRSDIESNTPSPKYGPSNALTFILLNQLSLDLNQEQKSTLSSIGSNAAFSLLGSQVTPYINSILGVGITNIRVNQSSYGNYYKFLFSGKYNNIRYSFGGNTEYLQLTKADIKFEYLLNPNFLIRVEQKSPVVEINPEDKIQELGLRYKFEF